IIDTLTIAIYLVGAVQGIVYGIILLRSTRVNKLANRILAILIFLFAYRLLVQTARLFQLGDYDIWYYFMLDLSWVTGALLYFYVLAQVYPTFKLKRSDLIHLLPVCIQIICSVFVRLQNLYWDDTRESLTWLGYWGYVVWMNYSTIYIIASILIIVYAYKSEKLLPPASSVAIVDPRRITWLRRILLSFRVYFSIVLAVLVVDFLVYRVSLGNEYYYFTRFYYYPFFIGISLLTYWIGLEGFKRKDWEPTRIKPDLPSEKREELAELADRINQLMETQKVYTNPQLTVGLLAELLAVKPYLVSQCLREIFQTKFTDYVNEKRVEELQRLLKDPVHNNLTLLALAMNAGFNSKSSFNRAVKKHLGVVPKELRTEE
ncbi:MAG: helix-turn-helix transcriptional regulator, partial [Bacteroidota bacterium]